MRIRTIKPEYFTHERLFDLEKETKLPVRIAFAGLWCAADRAGRFKWEPRRLKVAILPYDNIEFSRVLDALVTRGFVVKYASSGVEYGWIPSFSRHQVINNREKESDLPECPPMLDSDASSTREARVAHASKAEGKGREGNMEGKGKTRRERVEGEEPDFPPALQTQAFKSAWHRWEIFRAEMRKPLKPSSIAQQLKDLAPLGEAGAISCIEASIRNGWQGLFPDRIGAGGARRPQTSAERNAESAKREWAEERTGILATDAHVSDLSKVDPNADDSLL